MSSKDIKMLDFNQYWKSNETPTIFMQILIKRINGCKINLKKSSKLGEHVPCGYSMPTIGTFDGIENKINRDNKSAS